MDMNKSGLRRWACLGALASAVVVGAACKGRESSIPEQGKEGRGMPEAGREFEGRANDAQDVESFGQQPATGGSGQQQPDGPAMQQTQRGQPASPDEAQRLGPHEAAGAQGRQNGIGAPGYTTPQETGTPGTGVTGGGDEGTGGGGGVQGTRTEHGGVRPPSEPPSDAPGSDLSPGTPIGDQQQPQQQQ
jgi:hypothetical protein